MNRERAKELLPVIEAFANGEDIEYRRLQCGDKPWEALDDDWYLHRFSDDGENFEYRIKPREPREFWLNTANNTIHDPKRPGGEHSCLDSRWVKVREIIE